jgi:hypothetical protein
MEQAATMTGPVPLCFTLMRPTMHVPSKASFTSFFSFTKLQPAATKHVMTSVMHTLWKIDGLSLFKRSIKEVNDSIFPSLYEKNYRYKWEFPALCTILGNCAQLVSISE